MSINAAFGMAGVIVVNKVLLPAVLSYLKLPNAERFRVATAKRERLGDVVFRRMAVLCRRGPATVVVLICAALSIYGALQVLKVRIGHTTEGLLELSHASPFHLHAPPRPPPLKIVNASWRENK